MEMTIKKIEELIETAERFRSAYFWQPPQNASGRRRYEEKNSIPEFSWEEGGNVYTARYKVECSCKNIYAKGYYTKNGENCNLTVIKNSLKRLKKNKEA